VKSRIRNRVTAAAVAVCGAVALVVGSASSSTAAAPAVQAFGITGDGLTMAAFRTNTPNVTDWVQDIQGLQPGAFAVGIDFRVQNKTLYLVDSKGAVYTVAIPPAAGQPVVVTKVSQLQVALYGTFFGVDFNPAADRLRVVSDNGQNLRHNLNDHTTVEDANLNSTPSPVKGVSAAAYTNNDLNADTGTTLFDINPTTVPDQVLIQSPPNNGSLVPTGALTVDAGTNAGFDIFADLVGGKTVANQGFATLTVGGVAGLYDVNVLTGTATLIGNFPRTVQLTDLAVALDTA
jgi:hypothetical protein